MKILAASDIHGDIDVIKNLASIATNNKVDFILLAGDITLGDEIQKGMFKPFIQNKHKVFIMSGNHDSPATINFLSNFYKLNSLENNFHIHENIGIFGRGGANIGNFALEEEKFLNDLKKSHENIKHLDKKIMVSHIHPSGTNAEKMTNIFPGSIGIRKAIEELQPDIFICGHVHEAEGLEEKIGKTKIFNVGEKGKIINL